MNCFEALQHSLLTIQPHREVEIETARHTETEKHSEEYRVTEIYRAIPYRNTAERGKELTRSLSSSELSFIGLAYGVIRVMRRCTDTEKVVYVSKIFSPDEIVRKENRR